MYLIDEKLGELGCSIGTPVKGRRRGAHVAIEYPDASRVSEALRDRGVIVDYREPISFVFTRLRFT